MSTYLVAFIVSDFEMLKSESGKFRVWARSEAVQQARYTLDIGPKILRYYEDYFKIKFPLPKMDSVALPDFSAGAMENWGLITCRWVDKTKFISYILIHLIKKIYIFDTITK